MAKIIMTYTNVVGNIEGTDFKDVKVGRQTLETTHLKYYKEGITAMIKLSKAERALFDYLASVMEDSGVIYSNAVTRQGFRDYISRVDKEEAYTDNTVKFAFSGLKQKGFIIERMRGVF